MPTKQDVDSYVVGWILSKTGTTKAKIRFPFALTKFKSWIKVCRWMAKLIKVSRFLFMQNESKPDSISPTLDNHDWKTPTQAHPSFEVKWPKVQTLNLAQTTRKLCVIRFELQVHSKQDVPWSAHCQSPFDRLLPTNPGKNQLCPKEKWIHPSYACINSLNLRLTWKFKYNTRNEGIGKHIEKFDWNEAKGE